MRVGVVGDIHLPFDHPRYLEFCQDTFEAWGVDRIHFAGDVVEAHRLSFHDKESDSLSAEDEAAEALIRIAQWRKAFPVATVSIGNHDERHFRMANRHGIPKRYFVPYKDLWGTPNWTWSPSVEIDGVLYEHGTGTSGKDAAMNRAMAKRQSVVIGHVHTYAGVKWHMSDRDRIFGLNVGCGIDIDRYAFHYSKPLPNRPSLGCGIVLDGQHAYWEVMRCGPKEPYHKRR